METLDVIHKRASLKLRLTRREIEQEKIEKILDAARVAPSARNHQPWRFIVIRDMQVIETLVDRAFNEVNRVAKEAPVIITVCANPADDTVINGKEYYLFDLGLAVENMVLAATDIGLATHIMAGIDEDELKKVLGIPAQVRSVVSVVVSYPSTGSYDEAAKDKLGERTRKSISELVYANKWGTPF